MNHVAMLGCAIVEAAVLAAGEAAARTEVNAELADFAGLAGGWIALGTGEGQTLSASRTGPVQGVGTRSGEPARASVRGADHATAARLAAVVPGSFPSDAVCVLNHDTGDVTLVRLSEVGGPGRLGGHPQGPAPVPYLSTAGPPIKDSVMALAPDADAGVRGSEGVPAIGFTSYDFLHVARNVLHTGEAGWKPPAGVGWARQSNDCGIALVPEPTTLSLLGLGTMTLAMAGRRGARSAGGMFASWGRRP